MASTTQILAIVGAIIFGAWFFNKAGCNTDIEALCWNGPSLEEMLSGGGGSITEEAAGLTPESTPSEIARTNAPQLQRNIAAKRTQTPLQSKLKSRFGPGVNPYAAEMAHAYFVNNRVTIA